MTIAKNENFEKTFIISWKHVNYCIASIIKRKETETVIILLSYRFYSVEVRKINDTYLTWRRKANERIRKKNESFRNERSKRAKRHSSKKTDQFNTISDRISYLNQNTETNLWGVDRLRRDRKLYVLSSCESRRIQHSQTRKKLFNTSCQRRRTWHEGHERNSIHDHDDSESSRSINLRYCWDDHSQHHFRNALIEIA